MKISRVGKQIAEGHYKSYYISTPIEGDSKKMVDRYNIEQLTEDTYDIYDMFADLANAFNELKDGVQDGSAMKKWEERQGKIKEIIG